MTWKMEGGESALRGGKVLLIILTSITGESGFVYMYTFIAFDLPKYATFTVWFVC